MPCASRSLMRSSAASLDPASSKVSQLPVSSAAVKRNTLVKKPARDAPAVARLLNPKVVVQVSQEHIKRRRRYCPPLR